MKCTYCHKDLTGINHYSIGYRPFNRIKQLRHIKLGKVHFCDANCFLLYGLEVEPNKSETLMVRMIKEPNQIKKIMGEDAGKFDFDRFICPHGVKARFCKHQRSYCMTGELPRSVEDVDFYCTIGTNKCDWKEE